jgi:hypothetical protein
LISKIGYGIMPLDIGKVSKKMIFPCFERYFRGKD